MKLNRLFLGTLAAGLLTFSTANADPILVDPTETGSAVSASLGIKVCLGCYIEVSLAEGLDGAMAYLDVGDSYTFDFFDILVGGLGAATFNINATLAFAAPLPAANGIGSGGFGTIIGLFSGGFLNWEQPSAIDLGDGTFLGVAFESGIAIGKGNSETVSATVYRYGESSVAVSEPGVLALLGFGLLAVWANTRRRRQVV